LLEDPAYRDRVSELLAEEDWPIEAMPEIVGRLAERIRKEKGKTLQDAIREAEARGDPALARQLLAEHQALKDVR
jgi:hypothetical protein